MILLAWKQLACGRSAFATLVVLCSMQVGVGIAQAGERPDELAADYSSHIRPLIEHFCLGCHSAAKHKGGINLEQFTSISQVRQHIKPWQAVIEQLEAEQMPPEDKPQPTAAQRAALEAWVRGFLSEEAKARAGDPGRVPMRRLSNAECDYTIRELTGVDLQPATEFPADGAAGEGFTNAAEALTDISPTLLDKYLLAAREIAAHAVLLPDGFRFSAGKTRRDWTDQSLAKLRQFYAQYTSDGRIPLQRYLIATLRHREALLAGGESIDTIASAEKLNAKYLRILWQTLTDERPSYPLDLVRERWRGDTEKDAKVLTSQVAALQSQVWKVVPVGSYRDGNQSRQAPVDPKIDMSQLEALRVSPKEQSTTAGPITASIVAAPHDLSDQDRSRGLDEFRQCFPLFICYPAVIPVDETVCLKMYHREDEPLIRLFLDDEQRRQIDRLWQEHEFISQQPIAENNYLPLFIGFVTQDQPKELVAYFEGQRGNFRKRAEDFQREMDAAVPKQLAQLTEFTSRAYRRPLHDAEKQELQSLYQKLRKEGLSHEDAFRGVLARVLVSPSFLFRIEQAPAGEKAGLVNDWELAARLSYFLWSGPPDDELRRVAAAGKLHELPVLEEQTSRMLKDSRVRALGTEFGTQWIHVRGFDQLNEKSERLFPTFDQPLRSAMNQEAILFFQDLFQQDQPFDRILDADYTYLNETLARHYGIPGVTGSQWRKVEGVQKYGRGWAPCRQNRLAPPAPARSCAAIGCWRRCWERSSRARRRMCRACRKRKGRMG